MFYQRLHLILQTDTTRVTLSKERAYEAARPKTRSNRVNRNWEEKDKSVRRNHLKCEERICFSLKVKRDVFACKNCSLRIQKRRRHSGKKRQRCELRGRHFGRRNGGLLQFLLLILRSLKTFLFDSF